MQFDSEPEEYRGDKQSGLTYKELCMRQIERIMKLGSVEFRGGYHNEETLEVNGQLVTKKQYIADTRKEYISAIDSLYILVFSKNPDSGLIKEHEKIKNKREELYKKYNKDIEQAKSDNEKDLLTYRYTSAKRELAEELLSQTMIALWQSESLEVKGVADE